MEYTRILYEKSNLFEIFVEKPGYSHKLRQINFFAFFRRKIFILLRISNILCNFAPQNVNNTIMSTIALQNLWDTIAGYNLSTANKRWLAEHLIEQVEAEEQAEPYTVAELVTMAENGRKQIAKGQSYTSEQVLEMCERA